LRANESTLAAHAQIGHCTPPPLDCTGLPLPATVKVEMQVADAADSVSVGMDGCGRFLLGFNVVTQVFDPTRVNRFDIVLLAI